MSRSFDEAAKFCRLVHSEHKAYWQEKQGLLKRYKVAYEGKFWSQDRFDDSMIRIETPDAWSYIEGFVAAIFSRQPSVVIGDDIAASTGEPKLAQAAANRWLYTQRQPLELAARLALIYDYAGLKMSPKDSNDMLDRVRIKAIPCWEIIIDRDASDKDDQRFIGHCYYINLVEAKKLWGSRKYTAVPKTDYFQVTDKSKMPGQGGLDSLTDDYLFIEVVEIYDFVNDEVMFWSPQYHNGEKMLLKEQIPVRTYDDRPVAPIVPLFFSRSPSRPFEGLSAMARVYDQIYEKNIIRTYWANSVRRDSRQYLYKEGTIDEEGLAKVTAGVDGAMIAVDNDTLDGIIRPVEVTPISTNFDRYINYVESDLARGSVLAPFSRGEATKATATEITALAQYSASEIGKMARDRDEALEEVVVCYLRQLVLLADEGETAVLEVEGIGKVLTPDSLDAKFRINALDQGSTPLSDALRKQNLLSLLPTLQGLGVNGRQVLEELVRSYELPKNFLETAPTAEGSAPGPSAADIKNIASGATEQITPQQQLANALMPGPQ